MVDVYSGEFYGIRLVYIGSPETRVEHTFSSCLYCGNYHPINSPLITRILRALASDRKTLTIANDELTDKVIHEAEKLREDETSEGLNAAIIELLDSLKAS